MLRSTTEGLIDKTAVRIFLCTSRERREMNTDRAPSHVTNRPRSMPPGPLALPRRSHRPPTMSQRPSGAPTLFPESAYVPAQTSARLIPPVTRWERISAALLLSAASVPAIILGGAPLHTMYALASI